MPTTDQDYAAIEAARNKVSSLTKSYGETSAGAMTFADDVMKNVRAAREARGITNLQQDFGNATERLAVGRSEIVDRNKGELNPLTISSLGSQERAQNLGTLAKISQYEEQNAGTIDKAVQAGANTVQAQAVKIKAEADAAATELQNLMEVVKQKQAEASAALDEQYRRDKMKEDTRQFDVTQKNKVGATTPTPIPTPSVKPTTKPTGKPQSGGLQSPPMSAAVGRVVEYPPSSGVFWTSTAQGWK